MTPFLKNAIVLGLLSAVGPFAIDMYLPALPTIAASLDASATATQATLAAYFLSFGLCQIAYGPWSDMAGRKLPLYVGLTVFSIGGIGCGFAPSIGWLNAFRVLQGFGAASVTVIPRAIVRDLHTGREATKLLALTMLVFSVSPILAPLAGSGLIVAFGWRSVFVAITAMALVGLVLIATALPETRPRQDRVDASLKRVLEGFWLLLKDARFMGLTCAGGLGMSGFLVFLSTSSFVYIDHFGLSPTQYSFAFSINAIGFIGSAMFAAALGDRFGTHTTIIAAAAGFAFFALLLLGLVVAGADGLPILIGLLFCAFACLGLVIPTTAMLSLQDYGEISGIASALGGTLQMTVGAIAIGVAGALFDGTARPMLMLIAICAIGTLAMASATLRGRRDDVVGRPALALDPDDTWSPR